MIYVLVAATLIVFLVWFARGKTIPIARAQSLIQLIASKPEINNQGRINFSLQNKSVLLWMLAIGVGVFFINKVLGSVVMIVLYYVYKRSHRDTLRIDDKLIFEKLPLELEKIVMAVESGNDLVQSLKKISDLGSHTSEVGKIFQEILEKFSGGLDFAQAVELIKKKYPNMKLAFVLNYFKIAVKEGGEIIGQLKELSDTVLGSYENYIEKEVNKMPAKALMPLMLVLAGMLMIYLSEPLVQISKQLPKIQQSLDKRYDF
ncbi:MAG: type II secretion system F family protein [Deltaproteobacteria bacterium]|nr:type II secretion system F family protein [Deltaproteobacteria bacterium]